MSKSQTSLDKFTGIFPWSAVNNLFNVFTDLHIYIHLKLTHYRLKYMSILSLHLVSLLIKVRNDDHSQPVPIHFFYHCIISCPPHGIFSYTRLMSISVCVVCLDSWTSVYIVQRYPVIKIKGTTCMHADSADYKNAPLATNIFHF